MTTLIDRILSQIIPAFVDYNLRTKKHIIKYWDTPETVQLAEDRLNIEKQLEYNLRQILEAELTAVKGVDELIEEIINSIDVDWYDENWQSYSFSSTIRLELSKYIQDLKQTPVASKCTHIWYWTNAWYTDWKVVLKCRECWIIYNNRQEDSQPKVV